MTKKRYLKRIQLRTTMAHIGKWSFIVGFVLLIVGLVSQYYVIAAVGQAGLYFGATSSVIFSRLGWSKSLWKDILFNQISIILTCIGYGIMFFYVVFGLELSQIGTFAVFTGIVLAMLGMVFRSSIPE